MIKKIILYLVFVGLFVIERWIFLFYHTDIYGQYETSEWLGVLWHGLPHDLTCAGYVMAVPMLLELVRIWIQGHWHRTVMIWYLRIILIPVLIIFFVDLELYTHWGIRLDATPLIYLQDNPGDAIAQSPKWALIVLPILMIIAWWALEKALSAFYPRRRPGSACRMPSFGQQLGQTGVALLMCGVLFVLIRGGVTTSTMNVGRVYFSDEMPLNHAATNPIFSFFSSLGKHKDFARQYRFMSDSEAAAAIDELNQLARTEKESWARHSGGGDDSISALSSVAETDSLETANIAQDGTLLCSLRPNIVLLILESFSGSACNAITPEADEKIMPNVNRMYDEGVGFMNFYANSFRTDRGCASILASYPGQPTNSVMKDQNRCNNLQYLSKRLGEVGYDLQFIHGGDVNFTNMKGFLHAGAITNIIGDTEFPLSDRLSKWGVPDHKMFDFLYDEVIAGIDKQNAAKAAGDTVGEDVQPFLKVMLTLSSHEPFDVEYHHFKDPYVNSVAYSDSCLGAFIDKLKGLPSWDNLLIIALPDHCFAKYPASVQQYEMQRYHIPMFWTGGAVKAPRKVMTYGSQTDLAATLLAQLGVNHDDFNFSHDMMCDTVPHFGFYTWPDGFGFITDSCRYIQDNARDGYPLTGTVDQVGRAERLGKAYLQTLYDDLSRR